MQGAKFIQQISIFRFWLVEPPKKIAP